MNFLLNFIGCLGYCSYWKWD